MTAGLDLRLERPQIESLLSREFTFILNNWILLSLLFFILVATTFPLISEALTARRSRSARPSTTRGSSRSALVLLVLMGVGTLFGWKKTSPDGLRKAFRAPRRRRWWSLRSSTSPSAGRSASRPSSGAIPSTPGRWATALRAFNAFTPVIGISLCVFNVAVIVQEFALLFASARGEPARARRPRASCGGWAACPGLVSHAVHAARRSRAVATAATSSTSASS